MTRVPVPAAWRRGRRLARTARSALTGLPPLLGASPRELASFTTISMVAGDWATVVESARAKLRRAPDDEGALAALMVGLWELGREAEARAEAAAAVERGVPSGVRASVRFHHHLDDPAAADAAADALADEAVALRLAIAGAWRRHGDLGRALADADRVLAVAPHHRGALRLRTHAAAEQRVLEGGWAPRAEAHRVEPVPGRVLHMVQRSLPHHRSGSTYRTSYSVQAQAAGGLEPHVITQPGFGVPRGADGSAVEHEGPVPHHRIPRATTAAAAIDERLADYLAAATPVVESVRPAVLHPHSDYVNALVALELGRRHSLPVVYEVRGFPEVVHGRWAPSRIATEKSLWRRDVEAGCWRAADRIVTLAEVMKRHIAAHGVDPDRIVVVPNAVDADAFRPVAPDPALRARLGIAPDDLVLGYITTLNPYEGLHYLVDAVARLTAAGRPVRAVIVGDGRERVHLGQLARRLGIGDRVVLTGRIDHAEVPDYYALIDVFVVPRTAEITCQLVTPLKPYEAMASGKAVVVSRTAALQEMVIEGETGLTFAPEDSGDLARVVEGLADDPERRVEMGRRAREWVLEQRSWRRNAERYLALYRELGAA